MEVINIYSDSEDEAVPPTTQAVTAAPKPTTPSEALSDTTSSSSRASAGLMMLCEPSTPRRALPKSNAAARFRRESIPLGKLPPATQVFPILKQYNTQFRQVLGVNYCHTKVMDIVQEYIRFLRSLQEKIFKCPQKCRTLSDNVCRTMLLIRGLSKHFADTPYYLQKICELLAIYIYLELKFASRFNDSKIRIAERIVSNIHLHLETADFSYVLRIFAYIPSMGKDNEIVGKIFQRLIPEPIVMLKNEFSDRLYIQYLIAFYHWKDAESLEEDQLKVIAFANKFMKPKHSLKSSPIYASHLPSYVRRDDATSYFLSNMVFFNDLRNASLLDGIADTAPNMIDLSEDMESLAIDFAEVKDDQSIVPLTTIKLEEAKVVDTIDLTEIEDDAPWLTRLVRRAIELEVKLPRIMMTATHPQEFDTIELDSSDDESWAFSKDNDVSKEKSATGIDIDIDSNDSFRNIYQQLDMLMDLPEDSTDNLLRELSQHAEPRIVNMDESTDDEADSSGKPLTFENRFPSSSSLSTFKEPSSEKVNDNVTESQAEMVAINEETAKDKETTVVANIRRDFSECTTYFSNGSLNDTDIDNNDTIIDKNEVPKEAVTLSLEAFTNVFESSSEESGEAFLSHYNKPPLKTYLRKTLKRSETADDNMEIDPIVDVETDTETNSKTRPNVLFSGKVISLREDDNSSGGTTPCYLKVNEAVEISSHGSNVVFSMQGRRLSSFPPLEVTSSNDQVMPDFDKEFSMEEDEAENEMDKTGEKSVLSVKTIIKSKADTEVEKPITKRRSVWFSDKTEIHEIEPRSVTPSSPSIAINTITSTINNIIANKNKYLQSTSPSSQPDTPKEPSNTPSTSSTTGNNPESEEEAKILAAKEAFIQNLFPDVFNGKRKCSCKFYSPGLVKADPTHQCFNRNRFHNKNTTVTKNVASTTNSTTTKRSTITPNRTTTTSSTKATKSTMKVDSIITPNSIVTTNSTENTNNTTSTISTPTKNIISNNSPENHKRRKFLNFVPGRQSSMSDFDKYLENLQRKSSKTSNTATTKLGRPRRVRNNKQPINKITKSLVDITNDIKLTKMRPVVVVERLGETIFKANVYRKTNPISKKPAINGVFSEPAKMVSSMEFEFNLPSKRTPTVISSVTKVSSVRAETKTLSDILTDVIEQNITPICPILEKGVTEVGHPTEKFSESVAPALIETSEKETAGPTKLPDEVEQKPQVEADPSKSDLKPIKIEEPKTEPPVSETECFKKPLRTVTRAATSSRVNNGSPQCVNEIKSAPVSPISTEVSSSSTKPTEPRTSVEPTESPADRLHALTPLVPVTTEQLNNHPPPIAKELDSSKRTKEIQQNPAPSQQPETSKAPSSPRRQVKVRLKRFNLKNSRRYVVIANTVLDELNREIVENPQASLSHERLQGTATENEVLHSERKRKLRGSAAKKGQVLKKIFEKNVDEDYDYIRRCIVDGNHNLRHNIESINTPPPTPPSPSLSPAPQLEGKNPAFDERSEDGSQANSEKLKVEKNNNNVRPTFPPLRRRNDNTLLNYLASTSNMVKEFRTHAKMPTEVEIDSNFLALYYDYLIERKDSQATEEIDKIMPLLRTRIFGSLRRRRFESCSLPVLAQRRSRKFSSSDVRSESQSNDNSCSRMTSKRRKTICSDYVFDPSDTIFDEEICSLPKTADSPTVEVMRLHTGKRDVQPKPSTVVSSTVIEEQETETTAGPVESPHFSLDCSSSPTALPQTSNTASTPVQSEFHVENECGSPSRRENCESPPDISRMVVSRTYSKSYMVQHVFVPPEIERCIEEQESSTVVEDTNNLPSTSNGHGTSTTRSCKARKVPRTVKTTYASEDDDDENDEDYSAAKNKKKKVNKSVKRVRRQTSHRKKR